MQVSAVSTKHQTTREAVIGVATTDNAQIIFTDTPGIVDRKIQKKSDLLHLLLDVDLLIPLHRVRRDLVVAAWDSMDRADLGAEVLLPYAPCSWSDRLL